jgi:AraC family transcriptional regulator
MKEDYNRRINSVVEYINNHIDEKMDLETLAEIAHFSAFHFHRLFKAFQHETLAAYITRMRVETAARFLRYSSLPIETIAYNIGYELPSSFSKAFKLHYGITPSGYRNDKNIRIMKHEVKVEKVELDAPEIVNAPAIKVIYIRLVGAYCDLDFPGTFQKLWQFVMTNRLFTPEIEHIGWYHDDPTVTESSKLRSDVCLSIHQPVTPEGEVCVKEIPEGKFARFCFQGPYTHLGAAYDYIFSEWLPESHFEVRDTGIYEKYLDNPEEVAPELLRTAIYIPVQ